MDDPVERMIEATLDYAVADEHGTDADAARQRAVAKYRAALEQAVGQAQAAR